MGKMVKLALALALLTLIIAGSASASAGVNDVWFGSSTVTSGNSLDVFMSTDGPWFGLNLAFQYSSGVSAIDFTADSTFLSYIGGAGSVAANGAGTLANGTTGYVWETYPLIPDRSQWNAKIGSISLTGSEGSTVSIFTQDGEWNGATAIFDSTNYGTWVGDSMNRVGSIKTAQIPVTAPVPEPGSLLALSTGLVGMAGAALRKRFC